MKIKAYHKSFEYTYTLGVFETIELLKNKPDLVLRVYIKSNSYKNKGIGIIDDLCKRNKIDLIESDNTINKLSKKDNCFAIAIIKKYSMELKNTNHVVLVNPGDMGNMGTIIRTMLGFGYMQFMKLDVYLEMKEWIELIIQNLQQLKFIKHLVILKE